MSRFAAGGIRCFRPQDANMPGTRCARTDDADGDAHVTSSQCFSRLDA
ncbi:MAG: hypothetical protein R3D87_12015 [Paracoccaceae bacterium]